MKCYGVSIGGKDVCFDDAFTVHVPYGAVYSTEIKIDGDDEKVEVGFIKVLKKRPNSYKDGVMYISEDEECSSFTFKRMMELDVEDMSEINEKTDSLYKDTEGMNSRKELYKDNKTFVLRVHQEIELKDTENMGGGLIKIVKQKYNIYTGTIFCLKAVYICNTNEYGFGIFEVDDEPGDRLLSTVKGCKRESDEEKKARLDLERRNEEEKRRKEKERKEAEEKKRAEEARKKSEEEARLKEELEQNVNKFKSLRIASDRAKRMISTSGDAVAILRLDGTVYTYGLPETIKKVVESWKNIKQVEIMYKPRVDTVYAVGLKEDGTAVFVGNTGSGPYAGEQPNVRMWQNIKEISLGYRNIYGLRNDGTVVATGENSGKQNNVGLWKNVVKVRGGIQKSIGLCKDDSVVYSGKEYFGDALDRAKGNIADFVPGANKAVCEIFVLLKDGRVYSGYDQYDVLTKKWSNIVSISQGYEEEYHDGCEILGVTAEGKVKLKIARENKNNLKDVEDWENIACVVGDKNSLIGITKDGYIKVSGKLANSPINGMRIFKDYTCIDEEIKQLIEQQISSLRNEINATKGIFAGLKKGKLQARIEELQLRLNRIK